MAKRKKIIKFKRVYSLIATVLTVENCSSSSKFCGQKERFIGDFHPYEIIPLSLFWSIMFGLSLMGGMRRYVFSFVLLL